MTTKLQDAKRKMFMQVVADNGACFRMCTAAANLRVTGLSSDQLRKKHALGEKDSIRKLALTVEQVKYVTAIELEASRALESHENYGKLSTYEIVMTVLTIDV